MINSKLEIESIHHSKKVYPCDQCNKNLRKISKKQFTGNLGGKSDTSKKKESTTFSPNIKKLVMW